MARVISKDQQAREKIFEGIKEAADTVASTLGPRGHNVIIDKGFLPWVIHDGVKVLREIEFSDLEKNLGVKILKQAANKQVEEVGDGTTVVTLLAKSIIEECLKVTSAGIHAMSLRAGLERGRDKLVEALEKIAIPVKTLADKISVATISAEDAELGKMIGETVDKLGAEGVMTVEESKQPLTYVELQEGMQLDKGYKSPYFVTDTERMESTVEDTYLLITDMNVVNINELLPLLNGDPNDPDNKEKGLGKITKNLVIIAPDITDNAMEAFIVNKLRGMWNFLCVEAPLVGQKQKDLLADIAVLTGGTVISEDAGQRFNTVAISQLGRAKRVTSTADATLIVGGQGDRKEIEARISSIEAQLQRNEGTQWEVEKLRERKAKLTNGVAVVKVGGDTEVEIKERLERADDAVSATQAAVAEGIVPGGEVVYLQVRDCLDSKDPAERILGAALVQPFKTLVENAGYDGGELISELRFKAAEYTGFDVTDGEFKDLIKAGIIDPVKVAKSAIRNAVSVAVQIITSNYTITDEPKDEKK